MMTLKEFIRESAGGFDKTLQKVVKTFKLFSIPHYICGGFAIQEYGYARFTIDIDIIVPDVPFALEKLMMNGFKKNQGSNMTVKDRETGIEIDLLPGGKKLDPGPLTLPIPTEVTDYPNVLTIEKLISMKLSTYLGMGVSRLKDLADVVELIKINNLPRMLAVEEPVKELYQKTWDELNTK